MMRCATPQQSEQRFDALIACYAPDWYAGTVLSDCYHVFDAADPAALEVFIQQYQDCGACCPATGLGKDYEAAKNNLIHPEISNGPLEGVNSLIKNETSARGGCAGAKVSQCP